VSEVRGWEEIMKRMPRTVRLGAIAGITSFLSVAILVSFANFNLAQAQKSRAAALACGKQLQKQCGGVPVLANNLRECRKKSEGKISSRCIEFANYVVASCERDALQHCQAVAAGQGNILTCLRTSQRMVSPQCHAALDTAFVR
jgi:Cysteine rich repeat